MVLYSKPLSSRVKKEIVETEVKDPVCYKSSYKLFRKLGAEAYKL